MKHIFIFLIFTLSLEAREPINILTTTSIFKNMIENIGGDNVMVKSIVPLGSDPHIYDPSPSDVTSCKQADLIMINGMHLEVWIEKLIKNSKPSAEVITLTKGIKPIQTSAYPDPHTWMSAKNGIIYAQNIADALVKKYPYLSEAVKINTENYISKLKKLDEYIHLQVQKIDLEKRVLITNHDAFQYFGREYNIQLVPLMGISTEAEPKTSDIIKIISKIKEKNVPAIFVETSINPQLMTQIACDMNIFIGGSLFSDSLGEEKGSAGNYLGMLKTNTDIIVNSLTYSGNSTEPNSCNQVSQYQYLFYLIILLITMTTIFFAYKIAY